MNHNFSSRVGVVLLNWNGGEFTIPCVKSLLSGSFVPWKIVVVDNASSDGSPDDIVRQFPDIDLIRNQENLGATGGNNVGIKRLIDQGADLLWILNNDTVVHRECLRLLVEVMYQDPGIAVATNKIMYETPANIIWYAGGAYHHWLLSAYHRGDQQIDRGQYDTPDDVEYVTACSMLVRQSTFDKVGLFHEQYLIYDDDFEWSLRARGQSLRLRYVPGAIMHHKVSATMRKNTLKDNLGTVSALSHYLSTRNRIFTIRQHSDGIWQWMTSIAGLLANRLYISIGLIAFRRWEKLFRLWRGIYDGFRQNLTDESFRVPKSEAPT